MSEPQNTENLDKRYTITYKPSSNIFEVIKTLQEKEAEVYYHNVNNRQIGANIPIHSLESIKGANWLERIAEDPSTKNS
jgi:hypothetical protein